MEFDKLQKYLKLKKIECHNKRYHPTHQWQKLVF